MRASACRPRATFGVVLLFGGVLALGVGGAEPAVAGGLGGIDCPRTTTTTTGASTTSTTLDPLCVLLGAGVTKKQQQIASADEVWSGEIHTDGDLGGCLNSWDGRILIVVNDNKVTRPSAGFVTTTGQPGCTILGGAAGAPYLENFEVRGRATENRVRLKFIDPTDECLSLARDPSVSIACWGVPGGSVARGRSSVSGTFTTDLGRTTFETKVELSKRSRT